MRAFPAPADTCPSTGSVARTRTVGLAAATGVVLLGLLAVPTTASAATAAVNLGTAGAYSVLAGATVTNTGPSRLDRDLGLSPGTATPGFPPGQVAGATNVANAAAAQAKSDLTIAYNNAAGRPTSGSVGAELGGMRKVAGVYTASSALQLTGTVTLDGQGSYDSVFIFQVGSALTTSSASRVSLINGAQACNVFWQIGSSATIGTASRFVGTIMADQSISLNTGATIQGRALARIGQVSLQSNVFTSAACLTGRVPTSTPTPTATTSATPTATSRPTGTPRPSGSSRPTATPRPSGSSRPTVTSRPSGSSRPTATTRATQTTSAPGVNLGNGTGTGGTGTTTTSQLPNTGATPPITLGVGLLAAGGLFLALGRARRPRRH